MLPHALLRLLNRLTFLLLGLTVLVSPWLLGAWEMWYFWPLAVVLFAAAFCGGAHMLLTALAGDPESPSTADAPSRRFAWMAGAWAPFLLYATLRHLQAPVVMDAERIWLLMITPAVIVVSLGLNFSPRQRRFLFGALGVGMALQVLYGFMAMYVYDHRYVMWVPDLFDYGDRMKGSFFCPNHFSGFLEIGFCMGLALQLDRGRRRAVRLGGAALLVSCLAGIALSQSRGGWLSIGVVLAVALFWALRGWPRRTVRRLRFGALAVMLLAAVLLSLTDNPAKRRLQQWHPFHPGRRNPERSLPVDILHRLQFTSRGSQIGGALRAWRSAPFWGIGPGMHQNLWFRFAASGDGDRETRTWPSQTHHTFHSYEVHSDWVQLLEELGLAGFVLFLAGFGMMGTLLHRNYRNALRRGAPTYPALAAGLSVAAIAFHSLGDFNLQIPAVNWTLAAVVGLGLVPPPRQPPDGSPDAPTEAHAPRSAQSTSPVPG